MKIIYLDNAAATPQDPQVLKEIERITKIYGNPSSYNNAGRAAKKELNQARLKVARFLGAHIEEVVFTSSGSEANNLTIQGIVRNFQFSIFNFQSNYKAKKSKPHIITTKIEHPSVLGPIKRLDNEGCDVTYLSVDKEGFISLDELKKSLCPETILVSIMYANNEIGTIQPIAKIGKIVSDFRNQKFQVPSSKFQVHEKALLFHVDACQSTEYLPMNVNNLGVDMLTFNGSKIYGPRGIGALYIKRGVNINPLILGGSQEYGLRAGTENLPAIVGLAKAVSIIDKKEKERLTKLRDYFVEKIKSKLPNIQINGALGEARLPNNINMSVPDLDSENLLLELDKYGIYAGSGSACTAHAVEPSHVLKAIGVRKKYLAGALRFSMGRQTTKKDIDHVLKTLPNVVSDLHGRYDKTH